MIKAEIKTGRKEALEGGLTSRTVGHRPTFLGTVGSGSFLSGRFRESNGSDVSMLEKRFVLYGNKEGVVALNLRPLRDASMQMAVKSAR